MTTRGDESTVPTAAQDEVLVTCPETFDSVTRDDEIAVDIALLEETVCGRSAQNTRCAHASKTG